MPAESEIRVEGLREMNRAFARADKRLKKELTGRLREAAEPVRSDAERGVVSEIRNVREGDKWSKMRVGVTQRLVYVAPKQRGVKSKARAQHRRPNLAQAMLDPFDKALAGNRDRVVRDVDDLLAEIGTEWGRGG